MNARRLISTAVASLCVVCCALAAAAVPAGAVVVHEFLPGPSEALSQPIPAEGPAKEKIAIPGALKIFAGMTVDSGLLLIAEKSLSGEEYNQSRLDRFSVSSGVFEAQLFDSEYLGGQGKPGYIDGLISVAVGHATGEAFTYLAYGTVQEEVDKDMSTAIDVLGESGKVLATWTGANTKAGSFGPSLRSVAADNSANFSDEARGDVYIATHGEHAEASQFNVVDVFKPEAGGGEPAKPVAELRGTCPSKGACSETAVIPFTDLRAVAVDEGNGDVLVADGPAVDIFAPTALPGEYEFLGQITETPSGPFPKAVNNLAVDSEGDVYVTDEMPDNVVDEFKLSASGESAGYVGRVVETPSGPLSPVGAVAVNPTTGELFVGVERQLRTVVDVFGPSVRVPAVKTEEPSEVGWESAVLNGVVEPEGLGESTCRFAWGTSGALENEARCEPEHASGGSGVVAVHAAIAHLAPDTTYYYRLQDSYEGHVNPGEPLQDRSFTTAGPQVEGSVSDVAATSATFDARIDPHGAPTSYSFQYGKGAGYEVELPGVSIGAGEEAVEVAPVHVQGLASGTVYHYRVVAVSEIKGRQVTFAGADQTFTTQVAGGFTLPDGREWEMVSPPLKDGAKVDVNSENEVIEASSDGGAITYLTNVPTEVGAPGYSGFEQVLSLRGPSGWQSRDIGAPHELAVGIAIGVGEEYEFFSEDLSVGVVHPFGHFDQALSAEGSEQTEFLRTDFFDGNVDDPCTSGCYRPLVSGCPPPGEACSPEVAAHANVPAGTEFGHEQNCPGTTEHYTVCGSEFEGASPDGQHIVIRAELTGAGGALEENHLFEWSAGKLALVSILPDGEPAAAGDFESLAAEHFLRNAVSDDGSRVIWKGEARSGHGGSHLFLRDMVTGHTVQLDVVQPGASGKGGVDPRLQFASSDGSRVFFTDQQDLTADSGATSTSPDLYECEIVEEATGVLRCELSDLTPVGPGEQSGGPAGEVIGGSEDGSWLYFVANGVFAPGAIYGDDNLYAWHNGQMRLVAVLSGEDEPADWDSSNLFSRVSPNGQWLAFMSDRELVPGDATRDAVSGMLDEEVYLYNGETGHLICASCNPSGARPTGMEFRELGSLAEGVMNEPAPWEGSTWMAARLPDWDPTFNRESFHQPRYLSDGGRLFFDSDEALVPQDVDGAWDVYEYEPAGYENGEGKVQCTAGGQLFSERSGGCVGLISSGTSKEDSGFLEASETGGEVFFITSAQLLPQDVDSLPDVYDAHECTVASPCYPSAVRQPPACETEASCKAAPSPQPAVFGAPSSATFSGAGNIAPPVPPVSSPKKAKAKKAKACPRGRRRSRGRCVAVKRRSAKALRAKNPRKRRGR